MTSTTVKASVLNGARDLRLVSQSPPPTTRVLTDPPNQIERELAPLAADEVHVSVKATGLCGSDLHYFAHNRNGDILVQEPLTLGHESSGVVVAAGPEAEGLRPGDHVALEVGLPCGRCALCDAGRYNICRDMRFRSSARAMPHAQGTLQGMISHPAKWCHKLPEGVSLELGALAEPLSVAMHARDRASLPAGSTVLVFGAGSVGLLCAAVSKAGGAKTVVIADIQEDRVRFAVDNGFADAAVVVPMRRPETIEDKLAFAREVAAMVAAAERKEGGGPVGEVDGTYECTGVESCLQASIYATGPGGKIMLIGMGNPIQTLPISAASLREVDLVGVFRYANTYPKAIQLLASNDPLLPDLRKLITHRYAGMDSIPQAFDMAGKVKDEEGKLVLKVMIDM
ncbi:GroES-like protein [Phialemonium atrogriseum]|uniref:GroES-like protein n=1 Tax=Phialemonium atrogriseum TaxID=1093897 RepID=A0AAJ0C2H4_9PEZI|nr:GroES-like protein [Phialemonium atrogriseum]KAK1768950.1 GroES-like protein [Phialemonium atrogriseum]